MGYQLVETITVGAGGAASIEFTSIPQDGVDLVLVYSLRGTATLITGATVNLNSDTTNANYAGIELTGNGSTASSGVSVRPFVYITDATYTSNTFASGQSYISNYTSSAAKSVSTEGVSENNATTAYQQLHASSYTPTTAITSIRVSSSRLNLDVGSTASLYKITAD